MEIADTAKSYQQWLKSQMGERASSLMIIKVSYEHRGDDKEDRVSEGLAVGELWKHLQSSYFSPQSP